MAFHDQPRFTRDIDIIVDPRDFEKLTEIVATREIAALDFPKYQLNSLPVHKNRRRRIPDFGHLGRTRKKT